MEVTLLIRASAQEIASMLDLLAERGYVPQQWGRELIDPLPELEGLPPEWRLTPIEHAIVQHDLIGARRCDISRLLEISAGTITVYRRLIRKKLRHLPQEQRSAAITNWLRRFPGRQHKVERKQDTGATELGETL
ncbi:MAG TPA: hypothetical protein VFS21_02235 [Roseiflexaceae bacterium]|nr:hypothetical protein [Roseiflexaceae bacterium]